MPASHPPIYSVLEVRGGSGCHMPHSECAHAMGQYTTAVPWLKEAIARMKAAGDKKQVTGSLFLLPPVVKGKESLEKSY